MHISNLAPLIATLLIAHSSTCVATPLFTPKAVSQSPTATNPSQNDLTSPAEPTCLPPTPPTSISTFSNDCITAANTFFNTDIVSLIPWHWKRLTPQQAPQPGYNFLPYVAASLSCMLQLDVLNEDIDPNVEDQFALVQIAPDFRRLFDRCVGSSPGGSVVGGFVTVGPRRVLGLSIGPRRVGKGFSEEEGGLGGNGTGLVSVVA